MSEYPNLIVGCLYVHCGRQNTAGGIEAGRNDRGGLSQGCGWLQVLGGDLGSEEDPQGVLVGSVSIELRLRGLETVG